ncbi:Vesicle transport v-SNARE protein vti1 [Neolecta irregularis DAH-3]|uniref:Vesicle transport v-SNARE protein vti1 n=1 Tax=Neolecta irregularis (strain DAH-3) TaxID=1198029 RepID=A0A1U7LP36_NEOID|nr:Vesicle transport v-SNARE protein vti1 [Neolecta irregularis DAH-3]|eukprot:OLL24399.1 Vesicle transport v-SNARE protein vti1 [Neolecta irregularis DAH-3]
MDLDPTTEAFQSYETDFKLVLADVSQNLDQATEEKGEPRKAALNAAQRAIDEALEIYGQMEFEVANIPQGSRGKVNTRLRTNKIDLDRFKREISKLRSEADRESLLGNRYTDPDDIDALDQRVRLLSGTDRLERSSQRLRDSQRLAHETEGLGAGILTDLRGQREQLQNTRDMLLETDGYVDKSVRTLKGMARRMATNKMITSSIIAVLTILILVVIYNKFA